MIFMETRRIVPLCRKRGPEKQPREPEIGSRNCFDLGKSYCTRLSCGSNGIFHLWAGLPNDARAGSMVIADCCANLT